MSGTSPIQERLSVGQMLAERARLTPHRAFLDVPETGARLTFAEFDARVNQVANGLSRLSVRKGDFVAIMLPNLLETLLCSYGLKKLGAVEVAVNVFARGLMLSRMINMTRAQILIVASEFSAVIADIAHDLVFTRSIVVVESGTSWSPVGTHAAEVKFDDIVSPNDAPPNVLVADTESAVVLFTSGTTGPSKGCLVPHRQLVRTAEYTGDALGLHESDRVYSPYPLYHMRASTMDLMPMIIWGGGVVLKRRFSASEFWPDIHRYGITVFSLIGSVMQILWNSEPADHDRRHYVRLAWGGPLPIEPRQFEERFGLRLAPANGVFGMSEVGMVSMSSIAPERAAHIAPYNEVRIADANDDEVPRGQAGEILVRSREPFTAFLGYYGQPDETLEACRGMWFHTGDQGRMDDEGRLVFISRLKEIIRVKGHNISPFEIEEVLDAEPGVSESAAIGVRRNGTEDTIVACLIAKPSLALDMGNLKARCATSLAPYMVPTVFEFFEEFPRSPTGKVQKEILKKLVLERTAR